MEKVRPTLLKLLQKRGKEKMKKQNSLKSEVVTGSEYVSRHVQDPKCLPTEGDTSHTVMTQPSENKLDDEKNRIKTSTSASSSTWNTWSNRVEAVRELPFSFAGDVVDSDLVSMYEFHKTQFSQFPFLEFSLFCSCLHRNLCKSQLFSQFLHPNFISLVHGFD